MGYALFKTMRGQSHSYRYQSAIRLRRIVPATPRGLARKKGDRTWRVMALGSAAADDVPEGMFVKTGYNVAL